MYGEFWGKYRNDPLPRTSQVFSSVYDSKLSSETSGIKGVPPVELFLEINVQKNSKQVNQINIYCNMTS